MTIIYMQFGNMKGDVRETKHLNWIKLHSFKYGSERHISQESGSSRRNIGTPSLSKIMVTKIMDSSTANLYTDCASGNGSKCVIHFLSDNFEILTEHVLENAALYHYSMLDSTELMDPMEIIGIAFTRIESSYNIMNNGKIVSSRSAGYDIIQGKTL